MYKSEHQKLRHCGLEKWLGFVPDVSARASFSVKGEK
jgi:hypothetical protein